MALEIQIKEGDTHLSMKAAGPYHPAEVADFLDRANQEAEIRGYRKILLDVSEVAGSVPIADVLVLGEHCARYRERGYRIAIVSREGGIGRFFESIARNRGLILAVVPNQALALEWLID